MSKYTTDSLKVFIQQQISLNLNLKNQLLSHDINRFGTNLWSRTQKAKINKRNLDKFGFLYEDFACDFESEGTASLPTKWDSSGSVRIKRSLTELIGCIERGFLHKDGDCYVGIITDPTDQDIVAWFFQIN